LIKKLFAGGLTAALAAAALLLVTTTGGSTVTAAVNSVTASPAAVTAGTVAPSGVVVTVDANEGLDADGIDNDGDGVADAADAANESTLTILATAGTIVVDIDNDGAGPMAATSCAGGTAGCVGEAGSGTGNVTIPDAGNNIDVVVVGYVPPATGPATAVLTAIQANAAKTANVTVRGVVDSVTVSAHNGAPTTLTDCSGTAVANVIRSNSATTGLAAANLCTLVKDSAGNRLAAQPVIYTTTAGSFGGVGLTDVTAGNGNAAAASTLIAGATGTSGTEATVTASSGGKSGTTKVKFGGDPAACTVSAEPSTVQPGGSAIISINVTDSTNGPAPDTIAVGAAQANASVGGAGAAIVGAPSALVNGVSKVSAIAATEGPVALGANITVGANAPVTCTGTLIVAGSVVPPGGNPPAGDGTVTGVVPGKLSIGNGAGTLAELGASAAAQGCNNAVLWLNAPGGGLIGFFPTASLSAPNAAANAAYGTAGYNGGILIDCN